MPTKKPSTAKAPELYPGGSASLITGDNYEPAIASAIATAIPDCVSEPPAIEPPAIEPPAIEPPIIEPPIIEPPAIERPVIERPVIEPPASEPPLSPPPPAIEQPP
ncbi:hypothetical protein BGZ57DRAFT_936093 [Hyaloscypha finlandica]|nr:hypothetical protein BGZ57DRAFT_936093 [Hyaloscypha finlandica]